MKLQEFSTEFDVLFNNVTSNQAPGLNGYEKSVFLTNAQSQVVKEHFNNRADTSGGGFDGGQKRQYDFSTLIRTEKLYNINTFKDRINSSEKLDKRSEVFLFPQNFFLAVNEMLSDNVGQYSVIPVNYPEYQRLMLRPYSLPVKRAAWRILTDKKNCNFVCQDAEGNDIEDTSAPMNYKILSSWGDQKRTLQISIKVNPSPSLAADTPESINDEEIVFHSSITKGLPVKIQADCGWNDYKTVYQVKLYIYFSGGVDKDATDDATAIELLREGFAYAKATLTEEKWESYDWDVIKAAKRTDGFINASAPSKFTTFQNTEGRTFDCKIVQIPIAEVIGKFHGELDYKLRYIKTLKPIILVNLSDYGLDLSINGISKETECELPEEMHQEVLERAVALAKTAWQGGITPTST